MSNLPDHTFQNALSSDPNAALGEERAYCSCPDQRAPPTTQDTYQPPTTNIYTAGLNDPYLLDPVELLGLQSLPQGSYPDLEWSPALYALEGPSIEGSHHATAAVSPQGFTDHVSFHPYWNYQEAIASNPYEGPSIQDRSPDLLVQNSVPSQPSTHPDAPRPCSYHELFRSPSVSTHQSIFSSNSFQGTSPLFSSPDQPFPASIHHHSLAHHRPSRPLPQDDFSVFTPSSDSDSPLSPVGPFPRAASPRNIWQFSPSSLNAILELATLLDVCPVCFHIPKGSCPTDRKAADLKRHIRSTHGIPAVCCGVPLDDVRAGRYTVSPSLSPPIFFNGRWMFGGCWVSVSCRKDVLKRHIGNSRKGCIGDLDGDWHLFNQ